MTEQLNNTDNYILHTAINKLNGLEQRTALLEETQKGILNPSDPTEIEDHLNLVRELLSVQKENAEAITNISEDLNSLRSDLSLNNKLLSGKLEEIQKLIWNSPKNVVQEKRILFFPEHNAREYYAGFKWLFYIIIAILTYHLLKYLVSCCFHLAS